ncbi:MAG: hypothetical protein IJT97_03255 [Bacteroidaceae bacterium]|nr:hypothetical protein [Bacteroidaceae bacterium]
MMKHFLLILSLTCATVMQAQQLAFPGAEGFGAYASGGRGGKVVHVTNLKASGTGSLADAVSQSGRIVVFDVGGVIDITGTSITIASNITIAGQTAPGEGITIYGGRVIASKGKNIIMRYIRMRGGKSVNSSKCTLTLDNCENLIMDHCSVSWGPWDNVHIKDANNITWQNCIISEGIEPQRFGSITDGTRNWTVHHCLWADNKSRNPKMKCYIQYYNNVVYNYAMGVVGGHSAADNYQDLMNNYFIAGPDGSAKYFDQWTETDHMYSKGNYYDGNCDGKLNGSLITDHNGATAMQKASQNCSAPMNLETAAQAYQTIVDHVGASRVRDIHDKRIIEQLTSLGKKGSFITNEDELGGIGKVGGGTPATDSDKDGMPDEWETANGLNPKKDDANGYDLGGGYTNIEHYINSLAQKSSYLMYPQNPAARLIDDTTVELTWTNSDVDETAVTSIEMSEDGKTFTEVKREPATSTKTTISGLEAGKIYYFRLKNITDSMESLYSSTVSINDEYMRPGGGTPAGTNPFIPAEKKLYRILSYATIPYNSGTTINGTPKYLTFNSNGSLGSTESYQWDNPALLWEITPTEGGVYIQNFSTKAYISPTNLSIAGSERIGSATTPTLLTINYTGNQQPSQSGVNTPLSMYRINCPSNKDQQIRARGFADDWIWGSGTYDRADMIFTFTEVELSLVRLYLKTFQTTLETAEKLASSAQVDVTLGYPAGALDELNEVVAQAQVFAEEIEAGEHDQAEVDSVVNRLNQAQTAFEATKIMTFAGFSTELAYNIFSYGTTSNASTTTATMDTQRRYLYCIKAADGVSDSLVYRVGLSENQINAGSQDPIATQPAALWTFEDGENGYVYVRNLASGAYLQIANLLSAEPVTIYPYYAKDDNNKQAFYLHNNDKRKRCFNVGTPDADGKGGPLAFFSGYADRTRLRWVIEETDIRAIPVSISSVAVQNAPASVQLYNLQGMRLTHRPTRGIYIECTTAPDGTKQMVKRMGK